MRFSEIVGQGFFGIILSQDQYQLLDCYYVGSAHHLLRWRQATVENASVAEFHLVRHLAHLKHLMDLVFRFGNFNNADDRSYSGLDYREAWDSLKVSIPEPHIYDSFLYPDYRWGLGEGHEYDGLLVSLSPPATCSPERARLSTYCTKRLSSIR